MNWFTGFWLAVGGIILCMGIGLIIAWVMLRLGMFDD